MESMECLHCHGRYYTSAPWRLETAEQLCACGAPLFFTRTRERESVAGTIARVADAGTKLLPPDPSAPSR
jgi:hypothetical protein